MSHSKLSRHARRGAVAGLTATVVWAVCVDALNNESGFGLLTDFTGAGLLAVLGIPLAALAVALALTILRILPRMLTGFFLAAAIFVSLLWFEAPGWIFAAVLTLIECALGATLGIILGGDLNGASLPKRATAWAGVVLSLAANFVLLAFLHSDGLRSSADTTKSPGANPSLLTIENPSNKGPYQVKTLYYGSGNSKRRPEFGPGVAIRTSSVDASAFFRDFDGWKAWLRKRYWGFGMDRLPLNAKVFYPVGTGPFPLFLMVHGNHQMNVASDEGYGYLCELLASRGYIAVSVDENFLNIGLFHDPPKQQSARAWLLLEHLRLWQAWAQDPKNIFFHKPDLNNIALAGHSRGGEAAASAALFNTLAYYPDDATIQFHYGFHIKTVIAIAPPDGQYKPADQWRVLKDVSYLTLQGSNDADLSSFEGSRQYDHVQFSGDVPVFKSELYVYGANHGQFNTMWGRTDAGAPESWFLNLRPLLPGESQRQVAKVYVSAFLEATLRGRGEYKDLFRDYRRARNWLPSTLYLNRFQDQGYLPICTFNEDADVTTTTIAGGHLSSHGLTVWREGKIPLRQGSREYNGVTLGWNWGGMKKSLSEPPNYDVDLPATGLPLDRKGESLSLSVAVTDDDAPDARHPAGSNETEEKDGYTSFSIEAVDAENAAARVLSSSFAWLPPPFHVRFTKLEILDQQMYNAPVEPVFQTVRVPLDAFAKSNPAFNPARLRQVRLIFDQTSSRVIIIGGIGLQGP